MARPWFDSPKLPQEALDQLRALLASYETLRLDGTPDPGSDGQVAGVRAELEAQPDDVWWTDLAAVELCIARRLDADTLRARVGGWRRRMGEVVGATRYALYVASAPPLATADEATLRADLAECIRAVYYFYGAYGIAARSRSEVTKAMLWSAGTILALLGVLAVCVHLWGVHAQNATIDALAKIGPSPSPSSPATTLAVIAAKGGATLAACRAGFADCWLVVAIEMMIATVAAAVLGSIVSIQRRLQDPSVDVDPFYRYVQTKADRFSIAVISPIYGAIFGLVMYGLLASGLLSTHLVLFTNLVPSTAEYGATLLVFGFLAGFAEQLVPDALTRIATQTLGSIAGSASIAPPGVGAQPPSDAAPNPPAPGPAPLAGVPKMNPVTPPVATPEAAQLGHDPTLASTSGEPDTKAP